MWTCVLHSRQSMYVCILLHVDRTLGLSNQERHLPQIHECMLYTHSYLITECVSFPINIFMA